MLLHQAKNKTLKLVLALSVVAGSFVPGIPGVSVNRAEAASSDTNGHWAESQIRDWTDLQWIKGYEDGTFRPNAEITRGEFVALLSRTFALTGKASVSFSDVPSSAWYYDGVVKAVSAGIINGYEDGTFQPSRPISRQESAVVLAKLLKLSTNGQNTGFKDDSAIPAWSKEAVTSVSTKGYVNGYEDGTFKPNKSITRAEALTFLGRANALTSQLASVNKAEKLSGKTVGHLIVRAPGAELEQVTVNGDLIVTAAVGEDDVKLKGVTVKGSTIIRGGGPNSVTITDSTLGTVNVEKPGGNVRVVAGGTSVFGSVYLRSGAKLEETSLTGKGFGTVFLQSELPKGQKVTLVGGFDSVQVDAANSSLQVDRGEVGELSLKAPSDVSVNGGTIGKLLVGDKAKSAAITLGDNTTVKSLTLDTDASIKGKGKIEEAVINKAGAVLETAPQKVTVADGVTATVGGQKVEGKGTSSTTTSSSSSSSGGDSDSTSRPAAPKEIKAVSGNRYVTLSWTAPADTSVKGYNVYRNGVKANTKLITSTTYPVTELTQDIAYSLSVRSVNNKGVESENTIISAKPNVKGNIALQLLGVNDLHGKIDQVAYAGIPNVTGNVYLGPLDTLATYLRDREATNPYTLMVEPGDLWGGSSPISALLQDEPTIEVFEALGFDVGTVGNHEFDEGTKEMLRMIKGGTHEKGTKGYDGINFPIVAANVKYKDTGKNVLDPYVIKEVAGVPVGFIGVVTTSTPSIVIPTGIQDIVFTSEKDAINEATAELKAKGVKAIVVLAHLEAEQGADGKVTGAAADLANTIDSEVDIIFAAHNHKVVNGVVNNKLIVQAFEYGKAFVDVDVEIDPVTKDIVKKQAEVIYAEKDKVKPDPEIAAILAKYNAILAKKMDEVVGNTDVAFNRNFDATTGDYTSGYSNEGDHLLGNLIADGMRWSSNSDFGLMNGGGIRDNLKAGPITWGELFNIQPFTNTLVKLQVTGDEFEQIMGGQLSIFGADFSISGFKYTWDKNTRKIVKLTLPDGSPLDKNKIYTVTVNNFMATSTSASNKLISKYGKNPVQGKEDLEATVEFVKSFAGKPLPVQNFATGRIVKQDGAVPPVVDPSKVTIKALKDSAVGTQGTIEGIVTADNSAIGGGKLSTFVQDDTAGINIFKQSIGSFPDLKEGDRVVIKGKTVEYQKLLELDPTSIEVKASGQALPAAKSVTIADLQSSVTGEVYEGQLITTRFYVKTIPATPASQGFNVDVVDEYQRPLTVRVMQATGVKPLLEVNKWYEATGIVGQFNTYQLFPRKTSDVKLLDPQPAAPINPQA